MIDRRTATSEDFELARSIHHRAYRDVVLRQFGAWNEEEQDQFFVVTGRADPSKS